MAGFGAVLARLIRSSSLLNVKCREIRLRKRKRTIRVSKARKLIVHGIHFTRSGNSGFLEQELNRLAINTNNLRQMDGGAMGRWKRWPRWAPARAGIHGSVNLRFI